MIYFLIFISKVVESALSTLRLILVANGKKILGMILQFFITLVWVITTSIVIIDIKNDYFKALAFILGASLGSLVGSYIEECIAMGNNMLTCIINPNIKSKIENKLIEKNYKIIETNDCGKIIVLTKRKKRNQVKKIIKNFDENSILIIEKLLFD